MTDNGLLCVNNFNVNKISSREFFQCLVTNVVDGDTFDIYVNLGFEIYHEIRIRIKGIDTEELNDKDEQKKAKAIKQKQFAEQFLHKICSIQVFHKDKYGRWESNLFFDGIDYAKIYQNNIS